MNLYNMCSVSRWMYIHAKRHDNAWSKEQRIYRPLYKKILKNQLLDVQEQLP